MISEDTRKHTERVFVPGDDRADQISRLRDQGAEAMRQGDYERATQRMQDAAELEKQPSHGLTGDEEKIGHHQGPVFREPGQRPRREYLKAWRPVARWKTAGCWSTSTPTPPSTVSRSG